MRELETVYNRIRSAAPELELRRAEPMSRHTTFKVGGPAALMALPGTEEEAGAVLRAAHGMGIVPFFLGNGSNLLVSDEGYDGLVVKPSGHIREDGGTGRRLWSGSARPLSALAGSALDRGLSGLEFASGIPGTAGGAVVMNAGAYGGELAQVVRSVTFLDEEGARHTLDNGGCGFAYRSSIFAGHPGWLIVAVELELSPGDRDEIRAKMEELARRRREKQPLDCPSAGSTFKRPPPVDGEPVYAAALIDRCGLKGLRVGGAQVSEKHAGFIVNTGGATCADILRLMEQVRERVLRQTGVELEPEVKYLG